MSCRHTITQTILKSFRPVITSDNEIVNLCGKLVLKGSGSATCDNVNYIGYKYSIMYPNYEVASYDNELVNTICGYEQLYDVGVAICVSNIIDLIHMRDSQNAIFTERELNMFIEYFCT